jgi:hypothetical protein
MSARRRAVALDAGLADSSHKLSEARTVMSGTYQANFRLLTKTYKTTAGQPRDNVGKVGRSPFGSRLKTKYNMRDEGQGQRRHLG